MCKFYSGFGGVRGADSRINFRPAGQEIDPRIRYKNLHQPLPTMLKRRKLSIIKLTNFGFYH